MIYITTSAYKDRASVKRVIEEYVKAGIKNIELGAAHKHEENIIPFIKEQKKRHELNYTIHACFPPEKEILIVNLASADKEFLQKSREKIESMIRLSAEIGAKRCTFHAGFRVDTNQPGQPLPRDNITPYETAYQTFLESLCILCPLAEELGVTIGIEPNELSPHNLVDGKNELLLMCTLEELERLFKDLEKKDITNLGILLDLGHLKVTANSLNFEPERFIEGLKKKIVQIHIHDNDGTGDQHRKLTPDCWPLQMLVAHQLTHHPIILESGNLNIEEIIEQKKLLEQKAEVQK